MSSWRLSPSKARPVAARKPEHLLRMTMTLSSPSSSFATAGVREGEPIVIIADEQQWCRGAPAAVDAER
jgi:hypothetical protein